MSDLSPLIVHVFPSFARGGQQARLATLIERFGATFRHKLISLDGDCSGADLLSDAGDPEIIELSAEKSATLSRKTIKAIGVQLDFLRPQILCTYNWGAIEAVIANRLSARAPHLHHEDGFGVDERSDQLRMRRNLTRALLLRRAITVTPSSDLYEIARQRWRLPKGRVRHIPNGVDIERFRVSGRDYDKKAPIVGSVGALRAEKNFARLIRIAAVADLGQVAIYGDGPEREKLRDLNKALKANIVFEGATSAPETALARMDIFVMTSDTEQMPLSVIEAMAAGLPIVATDVGDVKDMVSAENREFITSVKEETQLVQSLRALCASPALRRRLGEANVARARAVFSQEKMIAAHRSVYDQLLSGRR